jgi:TonB-linked SusC/RagA family outer membrane protein
MRKILLLKMLPLFLVLITSMAWAQERVVTGRITAKEDGSSLPGVNVVVKGTTNGTVTDADGKYSVSVPSAGGSLVFSFIGLKAEEVVIGDRTVVDVQLGLDVTQLSEIVVTALGIERSAKSLGYSVGKVKNDELVQAKAINVATALSGKVAGLQISTINNGVNPTTRITLRGNRSITGNNQALIVVDGTQVPVDVINSLNPNDIENVTVLKGANAAALYGADASNGALIITTKKGGNQAPKITFSNTSYLEEINFLPKFNTGFGSGTEKYSRVYIPFENQSYGPAYDGSIKDIGRTLEDGTTQKVTYNDKTSEKLKAYDKGSTVQNDISLSGGDKVSSYFISLQDVNTKAIVPGDESRRTTIRMNAGRTYDKFKTSFNLSYSLRQVDKTTSDFYSNILNQAGQIPLSSYRNWRNYKNDDGSLNYANPNNYYNDYFPNPFMDKDIRRQKDRIGTLVGNIQLEYQFTDWFSALYRVGVTNTLTDQKFTTEKFTYNSFAKASGKYIASQDITGASASSIFNENRVVQDFLLTFKKDFGSFTTNLVLGNTIREEYARFVLTGANALVIPGTYNVGNRVGEPAAGDGYSLKRIIGTYADLNIGYKDYLFLHVSGRQDDYSTLSNSNRTFFYPGADISFVATDALPFLKENQILSYAKITASASKVGNVNVDPYRLQNIFTAGAGFPYGSLAGYTTGNVFNDPNLKPEFTTSYEIGADLAFFDSKVTMELAYYTQETSNQTVTIDLARSTGYQAATLNAGTMANKGFEVSVKATPITTSSGFKWTVGANYSNTDTQVTSVYGDLKNINLSNLFGFTSDASLGQVFAEIGQQFPLIKTVSYLRDPQGRVVVDKNSGYPLKDPNIQNQGQLVPRHKLGINTSLKYKGFTFNALAEYRGGNVVYHGLASSMWFTGTSAATTAYDRERFVFPNSSYKDEATGNYVANTTVATEDGGLGAWDTNLRTIGENFVTSGAFWKIREISLVYDVPTSVVSKTKFLKSASVGLVGRNLWSFFPSANIYTDPEFALGTNNGAIGLNSTAQTPPTRTYGFTVSLTF